MFAKLALFAVSALVAGASALPFSPRTKSLNNWGGHQSMANFDNFYGADNYAGHLQQVNVVHHEQELVCHQQQIEIVQQRLLVLQEYAKKIITETVCEVETQAFVFEQYHGSLGHFSGDIKRESGHQVGYDHEIASHYDKLVNDNYEHLGFSGHDYGKNYAVPSGHNWDESRSHESVGSAYSVAHSLY